jgi:hypothetical protein
LTNDFLSDIILLNLKNYCRYSFTYTSGRRGQVGKALSAKIEPMKKLTNNENNYTPNLANPQVYGHWNKKLVDRNRCHAVWYLKTKENLTYKELSLLFKISRQRAEQIVTEHSKWLEIEKKGGETT